MEVSKITALVDGKEKEIIIVHLPTEKELEKYIHMKYGSFYSVEKVKVEHISDLIDVHLTETALRKEVDDRVILRIKG